MILIGHAFLLDALAARLGSKSVFLDEKAIYPGQQFPRHIKEAILGSSVMLIIIGPYWLDARDSVSGSRRLDAPDDWVRQEVEEGLRHPSQSSSPSWSTGRTCRGRTTCRPASRR